MFFKNRKGSQKVFGTSRYRKIEKEKQEIILIDNQDFIATDEIYNGKQRLDTYSSSKSANMEALLLYYIRTKCNKECASAIGEKKKRIKFI